MKRNLIILFILALFSSSCTDFDEINTDIYGVTDSEYKSGGLAYGTSFMAMQQLVIPIGSPDKTTGPGNDLQNTDLISSGNYIGYFGNNNNWGFNTEANWNFTDGRMGYANENFYSKMFQQWQEINILASNSDDLFDQRVFAMANIVKIMAWLRATDVFGPIVYSNAGKGDIAPKLDSQEKVYRLMLADLEKSSEILNKTTTKILADYDLIYDGDTKKWVKLANSLMLRMAIRVHFKDKALAQEYITKALDPARGGVILSIDEEAKIGDSEKLPLLNPMIASVEQYDETKMGAAIWSYLKGYDDPRIQKYFTLGNNYWVGNDYFAFAPANRFSKMANSGASKPNVSSNSPIYWFRASETLFLKAEAALYGLIAEDAKNNYEAGIEMSFRENNVLGVETYLTSSDKPLPLTNYLYGRWSNGRYINYSYDLSNGNISPNWDEATTEEEKLQKIITQKYLALYPNAVEAWTEYRRTGYPYIMPPFDTDAPGRIGCSDCYAPERFSYAAKEYTSNPSMSELPSLLGGEDKGSTKLWWVRDNRPKQP